MILGNALGADEAGKFTAEEIDDLAEVALDEITRNPVIDEEIRNNKVIMKELRATVAQALGREK